MLPHSDFIQARTLVNYCCHTQPHHWATLELFFIATLRPHLWFWNFVETSAKISSRPETVIAMAESVPNQTYSFLETQLQCQNLKNGIEILSVFEFSEDKIALEASCSRGRSCWTSRRWRPRPNARGRATGSGKEIFWINFMSLIL